MILDPIYVSQERLEKMKEELDDLRTHKRREIIDRIEKAKDMGDLSENADYHDAKEEQARMEGRISELADAIRRAAIIEAGASDAVRLGSCVRVEVNGREKNFSIVGSTEADPIQGLISNESPLGRALIGKKVNEAAEVKAPAGIIRYVVVAIN